MFYKKLLTSLMLTSILSLSLTPLLALAEEQPPSTEATEISKEFSDSSLLAESLPELTLPSESDVSETASQSEENAAESYEELPSSESTEQAESHSLDSEEDEEDTYLSPIITEDNQSSLGSSLKTGMRSFSRADTRLAWDQSKLPRTDFIDVSSHQGNISVAEYNNLKKYGVSGVVVKLTESTSYRNPYAKNQIDNAKAAGLKVSAYHYSWFTTKKSAEAEAKYFAAYAKELNLGPDTVMVNDIEEPKILDKVKTADSVAFANALIKTHKFNQVIHYSSLSWFSSGNGPLDIPQLGGAASTWIAQYLYQPSKDNLLHQTASAWQWSSQMLFPGEKRVLDVNIDYNGRFSKKVTLTPQGPYIPFNKYVNISNANDSVYSNFNWKERYKSSTIHKKTYLAKGKYDHINGNVYYSIYDSKDNWMGYINSQSTTITDAHGSYIPLNRYVSITRDNNPLWSNFNWKQKGSSKGIYNKTLLAKGEYRHYNGSTYYSLYDSKNVWLGYIHNGATKLTTANGLLSAHSQYVTVKSPNYKTWADFSGTQQGTTTNMNNKTYLVKGANHTFKGPVYYSLYDAKGKWFGLLNKNATKPAAPQGPYQSFNKSVTITNKNYALWSNFKWKRKPNSNGLYNKKFIAKGLYKHTNGSTYYSLYDSKDVWRGYINSASTKLN